MTKEDLTIWQQTIKKVKIKGHISMIWVEYMNQNRKILNYILNTFMFCQI
jgi:hypothetical protein